MQVKNPGLINLLGGRNNAGKTTLLEALYLMGKPDNQSIEQLFSFRDIDIDSFKNYAQYTWDSLFYQQNTEVDINLECVLSQENSSNTQISCEVNKDDSGAGSSEIHNTFEEVFKSILRIKTFENGQEQSGIFYSNSVEGSRKSHKDITVFNIQFISAKEKPSGNKLTLDYEKIQRNSDVDIYTLLLQGFRLIDNTVERFEPSKVENTLKIKRKNEKPVPITLLGDAMNKIANYILKIAANRNSVLLIDEIENGIHFENQEAVWEMLFKLCEEFNVQIFATTHSGEMIEAFNNIMVIKNNLQDKGNYYEMARHYKTNNIFIQMLSHNSLRSKILKQDPIRGEIENNRRKLV